MDAQTLARFEAKVHPEPMTGCYLWTGAAAGGYGTFRVLGQVFKAHRLAYEHWVGPIPDGLCVLHRCDTPACVNVEHLFLGTHKDNSDDKIAKGRGRNPRADAMRSQTHCKNGHEFTEANTYRSPGHGSRRDCRQCRAFRVVSRRARIATAMAAQ